MKLMFASDIHGSAECCRRLLAAYSREGAERLLLLGDILYHGPRNDLPEGYSPKEVIKLLNAVRSSLLCVRGNCDCEVDQMVLEFPILADYAVIFEAGRMLYLTHGHHWSPDALPPINDGDALISGHTHILMAETRVTSDGRRIHCLNPGSVSLPKNGNPRSYMVYEDGTFTIKTLDGEALSEYRL